MVTVDFSAPQAYPHELNVSYTCGMFRSRNQKLTKIFIFRVYVGVDWLEMKITDRKCNCQSASVILNIFVFLINNCLTNNYPYVS